MEGTSNDVAYRGCPCRKEHPRCTCSTYRPVAKSVCSVAAARLWPWLRGQQIWTHSRRAKCWNASLVNLPIRMVLFTAHTYRFLLLCLAAAVRRSSVVGIDNRKIKCEAEHEICSIPVKEFDGDVWRRTNFGYDIPCRAARSALITTSNDPTLLTLYFGYAIAVTSFE